MPATRVRRECCCSRHSIPSLTSKADEKMPKGSLDTKLRSTSTIARLHATAARLVAKPMRATKNVSADIPVIGNTNTGTQREGVNWEPSLDTIAQISQRVSAGVGVGVEDQDRNCPSSSCFHVNTVEQRCADNGIVVAATLGITRSLCKGESCDSRDCTSKNGCTEGSCSDEETVDKNGETVGEVSDQVPTEWSSSDSDDWLFTEESAEPSLQAEPPLQPAGLYDENMKREARDGESPPRATAVQEGGQKLLRRETPNKHCRHRGSRGYRRGSRRRGETKAGAADRDIVDRDKSWSNRSLTVIFKELGLHQSCQRAVLSKHMPATFKGDEDGMFQRESLPLPRIDRPHFRPTFVGLAAAGKGSTVRPSTTTLCCVEIVLNNSLGTIYLDRT